MGYLGALVMGIVLGLTGGGGSILTVPILVYLFGLSASVATGYSLFIVGVSASVGAWGYANKGQVAFKEGFQFALPALIGVFVARRFIVPALPDVIFQINDLVLTKDRLILTAFGIVTLLASFTMIRGQGAKSPAKSSFLRVAAQGLVIGVITGFVGAGGGFLIVPALVLMLGLDMKRAVGTSLAIIAFNSTLGFTADLQSYPQVDWNLLGAVSALSIFGVVIGTYLSRFIPAVTLKKAFGYFVLAMSLVIIISP
ncbi:MAG: permease [Bdellovibrionales bacterium CG10_big_fil_rev_8_21_14_0_10_45_34]|nr:MAG: permease [Bdellovibrionales bacterium CG10_big_fil_rev_8_21_14_0_10_45_34]